VDAERGDIVNRWNPKITILKGVDAERGDIVNRWNPKITILKGPPANGS
jgi:hypothetical protein